MNHSPHSFMYELLQQLIEYIFPPSADQLYLRKLTPQNILTHYEHRVINSIHTVSRYSSPSIRALIHEAKFHNNTQAFALLNCLLAQFLSTRNTFDVLIPIPLSKQRLRMRGYNQISKILHSGGNILPVPILEECLIRVRNTTPQTELSREARLQNMYGAFVVTHGDLLHGKHILLIDDVTTTGSTLITAKKVLTHYSPASITCIALAH